MRSESVHVFVDGSLGEQLDDRHVAGLTDSVRSILGLKIVLGAVGRASQEESRRREREGTNL